MLSELIEKLRREHGNFTRLLDQVDEWIQRFDAGEAVEYELLHDIMYYMTHYPDQYHHPLEDLLFAELARHHEEFRAPMTDLAEQHIRIAQCGKTLIEDLEAILGSAVVSREMVVRDASEYSTLMRRHMEHEEETFLPMLERYANDIDWARVLADMEDLVDPIFGEVVEQRYQTVHRQLAKDIDCGCDVESKSR